MRLSAFAKLGTACALALASVGAATPVAMAAPAAPADEVSVAAAHPGRAKAVSWARSMVGKSQYHHYCELFVELAYGTSGRYASAKAHYNAAKAAGRLKSGSAPAGTLVFMFMSSTYGHVVVSLGNGTAVSTGQKSSKIEILSTASNAGWADAPSSWPGR
ncbi:NlpC/P60 family protein [Allokutzneria sp. A3M-2-11 16]|uniref:NlpC/P60 family protein n=1 Tax=Allokutzneria sp. A3M-2-11 16 TaxID=2962043 RepID=UPI0020B7EE49|nr:NlpC/P60 family protein [Allokutzneria sp. A3M-2-11 16]MCP3802501.1 NlpC/P60 family protein [Allokutzneria sp. A3M-2-11 16]